MIQHIKDFAEASDKHQIDMDEKYPNRHKEVHKVPCKQCPSVGEPNPESQDIKNSVSKEHFIMEYAFVCAWRQSKLCKGLCDFMEVDQQLIDKVYEGRSL